MCLSVLWLSGQNNGGWLQSSERLVEGGLASLGLAISHSLTKTMRGRIEVANRAGLRSIFTLSAGFDLADLHGKALDAV